ncbi:right-handed parallel beta-helix repeat-containing protein [uncultured Methanobrevibacter sp.]|uniref:right-handed parallel beta-helix repeat-containing protein n=1 Tax=uncultured Methanobrevibacter sp. TaxID=253161 RepID=UPI0025E03FEA|nr:hypothetical protein [uncultured Methanobrevibacter sp.]
MKTNQGLIIKNSTFQDNEANDYYGGAVYIGSGNLTIYNSIFENNLACGGGGAIFHSYDGIYINGCLFRLNKAEKRSLNNHAFGGAIVSHTREDFYIINSTFVDNYADSDSSAFSQGGAIYIDSGKNLTNLYIDVNCSSSSTFINNHANYDKGGAIYTFSSNVFAENTIFSSNYAQIDGGAVYSESDVNVKNCFFDSNNVEGAWYQCHGGAIYANGDVTVDNSTFKDNHAEDYGGAIYGKNVFVNRNEAIGEFSSFFINNKVMMIKVVLFILMMVVLLL